MAACSNGQSHPVLIDAAVQTDPRDEQSGQMSVAITEEVESKALNHRDADVDDDEEDYYEGFEDEDYE